MAAVRYLFPLLCACLLPVTAWAAVSYTFRPELPTARGVDVTKLNDIVPKLKVATGTVGTIKPSGGSLKLNGLTLEFPKGAVSKPTKVQWVALQHPDILFGWVLEPRDTRIAKPLTLHSPKTDLVFQLTQLGTYVLMADRKNEAFHLVSLPLTLGPVKKAPATKPAPAQKPTQPGPSKVSSRR
ncbi:MAG: hypothetical protein H7338_23570 [Candidatus Sericytochromatia bacterium]|nr:hypothetical protein [Candidatus Sericytochromatia bacterium]